MIWLRRLVIFALFLALWQGAAALGWLNPMLVGTPALIAAAGVKDGATLLAASRVTLFEILAAGALAWIAGVALGVLFGIGRRSALVVSPLLSAFIAAPLVVFYPVIVAWTGIGPESKIVYAALTGFFPIALSTIAGVSSIDRRYVAMAQAMGASHIQILTQVVARLALPAIISGLRVGTSLLVIAVVQSEMLSATDGLGFWISYHRSLFNVGQVYFGVGLVLILAAVVNALLGQLEKSLSFRA